MDGFQEPLPAPTFLAEGGISSPEGHLSHIQPHSALLSLCMQETIWSTCGLKVPASKLKLEGILLPHFKNFV